MVLPPSLQTHLPNLDGNAGPISLISSCGSDSDCPIGQWCRKQANNIGFGCLRATFECVDYRVMHLKTIIYKPEYIFLILFIIMSGPWGLLRRLHIRMSLHTVQSSLEFLV
jgi:hypothetical protein